MIYCKKILKSKETIKWKLYLSNFRQGTWLWNKQTRKLIKRTSKSRQGLCSLLFAAYLNLIPLLHRLVTKVRTDGAVLCRPECQSPHTSSRALWLLTLMGEKGLLLENLELWVQGTPIKLNEAPRLYRPKKDQGKLICLPRFYL